MATSKAPPKPDKRDCPNCKTRMEMKAEIQPSGCGCCSGTYLWQCPECKNIEVF